MRTRWFAVPRENMSAEAGAESYNRPRMIRCLSGAMRMSAIRLVIRDDAVAVLTLDQPGSKANVLTAGLWTELEAAIDSLSFRADLKGLVLASAKPGIFIAGADLKLLAGAPGPDDPAVRAFLDQGLRTLEKLEALPLPTCAAIDGAALGGGLEVALACDYRICGTNEKVKLGLPEVTLGLIPGWGGTQRLPRVMPIEVARRMLVTGEAIDGPEACALKLAAPPPSPEPVDDAIRLLLTIERPEWTGRRAARQAPIPIEDDRDLELLPAAEPLAKREAIRVLCLGAAVPSRVGIALETDAFMKLAGSDESKRLIAEFFASRKR